jgi:branched-chain amino acid transport system permease protein
MDSATLIQTLLNSVVTASIYALVAVGLAMAFGVMKMANFAHGEFFMVGSYTVYVLYQLGGFNFWVAVALSMPIVALLGVATERLIFRPTGKNILAGFMATVGLGFVLQVAVGRIWGVGMMKRIDTPYMGAAEIGDAFVGWQRLIVIPCAIAMLIALRYFLYNMKLGKALRACAQEPEAAALMGINIRTMTMLAMALAGASAGLAGALMAPIHAVTPYMGHGIVLIAFVVVIVGGTASIGGAVLAAVILGFIHTFVTTLTDSLVGTMVGVGFMAITLVIRPQGLLGREKP